MASAEKSIIPEFKIVADRLGVTSEFRITKNVITHINTGSFIYFSGIKTSSGDQTANLKSIAGITTWVIEEGEDFNKEDIFEKIDDSIRTTNRQNRVIFIMNPTVREHFIYPKWLSNQQQIRIDDYDVTVSAEPGVTHIHTTYHIAKEQGYLSAGWLEKADQHRIKAEQAEDKYQTHYYYNYIGGWKERADGAIFTDWQFGEFDQSLPYAYGLDFGFEPDPSALIKVAIDEKRKVVYLEEELYQTRLDSDALQAAIKARIRRSKDMIVADSANKREIQDLSKSGLNIIPAKKGPDSVRFGLRAMLGYQIIVSPNSTNLKKELSNYVWNDRKSDTPVDEYNHLIDAARYAFTRLQSGKTGGVRRRN